MVKSLIRGKHTSQALLSMYICQLIAVLSSNALAGFGLVV